jgi:alkylation response protein AidB-like acyl-CoA dehydrogenase
VWGDLARLGGARTAREALAARLLDPESTGLPDLDLGERANAFRSEVRDWLATHWDPQQRARERARPFQERGVDPRFSRALGERGWIAVSWPREYGGRGLGPLEQFVFLEEMTLAGAPLGAHSCASEMIGPALIAFGSEEQKTRFLPCFLRGELTFSLGYSESEAGSDLASLRLRAERDGDGWVLNGEKLWTSRGDVAHYHWLAARTNPTASPPHAGITMFMVPLDSPGITIRTGMAMYGHTFSSVHYDAVRVPDSARVGAVDGGWKVITHALASERIVMGSYVAAIRSLFDALLRHVASASRGGRPLRDDALLRDRLGGLAAEIEAARQLAVTGGRTGPRGGVPVHEAAMSKVYSGELLQRLTQAAIDLLGPAATLGEDAPLAILDGRIEQQLRRSIMMVVGGGTAEVQRNLIAIRGLGLPR